MSTEESKDRFKKTGERVQESVRADDLFKAMEVAMSALKEAVEERNEWLKDSYLGLVRAVHVLLENEYASKERRKVRGNDA
ncbi:MAG: hypothetical protein R3F42_03415 [Pseudomonadota bacterium]